MADYTAALTAKIAQSFHIDFPQVIYKTQWHTEGVRGAEGDPTLKQTIQKNIRLSQSCKSEDSANTLVEDDTEI